MPYTGKDDDSLPKNVKDMSDSDKAQWVEVFNSAFASCMDDDGENDSCESSAFAQANGVIKKKEESMPDKPNWARQMASKIHDMLVKVKEIYIQDRVKSLGDIYNQVFEDVWEYDPYGWLMDIFREDDGSLFAVIASEGKLYRTDVVPDENDANSYGIQEKEFWTEVMQEFVPVKTSALKITRTAEGRYRGFLISSTTVLNRNGEIDSTKLHTNLNMRASASGNYPYIDFFHLGEKFRMGLVDYLALEDNVAIASFLFDDIDTNDLARCMVKAYEADPEFWGASISFYPRGEPAILNINDVKIRVYEDGDYEAITILPEASAASWMTALVSRRNTKEVMHMNSKIADALKLLAGDDEELAKKFIEMVDGTNREISEKKLIARNTPENVDRENDTKEEPVMPDTEKVVEEITELAEIVQEAAKNEPDDPEIVLTDELVDEIARRVLASMPVAGSGNEFATITNQLEALSVQVASVVTEIQNLRSAGEQRNRKNDERFSLLESADTEQKETWKVDLPRRDTRKLRVSYRPSIVPNVTALNAAPRIEHGTYADVAESTLANIKD